MRSVLILGSNGLLGSYLYRIGRANGLQTVGLSRTKSHFVDIQGDATNYRWVERKLAETKCDVVINAIKFKGSTDDCETRKAECWQSNFALPAFLASTQRKLGYVLVQISTDWVYEGKRGELYDESSLPYPQNYYALSKFAAEIAVSSSIRYLTLRTTGLFGLEKPPRNILARLIDALQNKRKFEAASDEYAQPISALELSNIIYELLERGVVNKVLNATGPEYISRFQFARCIARTLGYNERLVSKVSSSKRSVKVPRYLRTDNTEMQRLLGHEVKPLSRMIEDLKSPGWNLHS